MSVYATASKNRTLVFTGGTLQTGFASVEALEQERDERIAADNAEAAARIAGDLANAGFDDLPSLMADTSTLQVGSIVMTKREQFSYEVVAADPDLTTAGGSMLRVMPNKGQYDIEAFGAIADGTTDNSPMITKAIQRASAALGSYSVRIPTGIYAINAEVDVSLGPVYGLSIVGDGMKSSVIKALSTYDDGIMKLTRTVKYTNVFMDGVALLCDKANNAPVPRPYFFYYTATIGLDPLGQPDPNYGYGPYRNFTAENCVFGGYDEVFGNKGLASSPVIIEYGRRPLVNNCYIIGRGFEDTNTFPDTYHTGYGILFKDCYYGSYMNSFLLFRGQAMVGFEGYQDDTGGHADFEGAIVRNNELVGFSKYGVFIDHFNRDEANLSLKEPGFFVQDNHIHAHQNGIRMLHHGVATITGNNIATTNNNQYHKLNHNHIYCEDVHSVIIANNLFWGPGYYISDTDCSRGIVLGPLCTHVSIDGNHFFHKGIGVFNTQADTLDVVIGDNVWQGREAAGGNKFVTIGPVKKIWNNVNGDLQVGGWKKVTFTPELRFGGSNTGITYNDRTGVYYRRGNEIRFTIFLNLSSKGTATGVATVTGLPNADGIWSGNVAKAENLNIPNEALPNIRIDAGNVQFRDPTANLNGPLDDTAFGNITNIEITGSYFAVQD